MAVNTDHKLHPKAAIAEPAGNAASPAKVSEDWRSFGAAQGPTDSTLMDTRANLLRAVTRIAEAFPGLPVHEKLFDLEELSAVPGDRISRLSVIHRLQRKFDWYAGWESPIAAATKVDANALVLSLARFNERVKGADATTLPKVLYDYFYSSEFSAPIRALLVTGDRNLQNEVLRLHESTWKAREDQGLNTESVRETVCVGISKISQMVIAAEDRVANLAIMTEAVQVAFHQFRAALQQSVITPASEEFRAMREEIRQGNPRSFRQGFQELVHSRTGSRMSLGLLDTFVDSVLDPNGSVSARDDGSEKRVFEMVHYQPSSADLFWNAGRIGGLSERDLLVDLGSGPGVRTVILGHLLFGARSQGVEFVQKYVDQGNALIQELGLSASCQIIQADARTFDFSKGTFFYLFNPFTGSIRAKVDQKLIEQAESRPIRVATSYCYPPRHAMFLVGERCDSLIVSGPGMSRGKRIQEHEY